MVIHLADEIVHRDIDSLILLWATLLTDLTLTIGGMLGIITWIARHDKEVQRKEKEDAIRSSQRRR